MSSQPRPQGILLKDFVDKALGTRSFETPGEFEI